MPFVKAQAREDGIKVKSYYRLNSVWNFWFGFLVMIIFFAIVRGR